MRNRMFSRAAMLSAAVVLCLCVLSFYRTTAAPPRQARPPFANDIEQRFEMIRQLKELNALLKEQNALLRTGTLKVEITQPNVR